MFNREGLCMFNREGLCMFNREGLCMFNREGLCMFNSSSCLALFRFVTLSACRLCCHFILCLGQVVVSVFRCCSVLGFVCCCCYFFFRCFVYNKSALRMMLCWQITVLQAKCVCLSVYLSWPTDWRLV